MKNLEMQTIEANSAKLNMLKEKKQLERSINQLKEEVKMKDSEIDKMSLNYEAQFKDISNRFSEEFDEINEKMARVKQELEKYREYKIKYEFMEKDHKGQSINPFWVKKLFQKINTY